MGTNNRLLIEEAVELIEENLKTKLSLDELSERLCLSKYHLHRLFRAITGMPMIYYVRGRKLSSSLNELCDDRLNIIDIACEYDFEYEQSYVRAFKRLFRISPSQFRKQHCELPVIQRMDTSLIYNTSQGILIAPRYCKKPKFYLAGIKSLINHNENYIDGSANKNALNFYHHNRHKLNNCINPNMYYGLITYYDSPESDYYMPSVEVSEPFTNYPPFTCETIETCDYAVFRYVGFHSPEELNMKLLYKEYNLIDLQWKPVTNFKNAGKYHFERIDMKLCSSTYCEADIYMPII